MSEQAWVPILGILSVPCPGCGGHASILEGGDTTALCAGCAPLGHHGAAHERVTKAPTVDELEVVDPQELFDL